ncbi:MAG: hypothetical protein KI792_10770 [Alphaproteobacteria bacterium]|nr:hypothetical protein [Alphaproteobacteria bacterium SS10]
MREPTVAGTANAANQPDLRMVVALPRSGSTMTMCLLAEHQMIGVTSRLTLMGNMQPRTGARGDYRPFEPDYSIYDGPLADPAHPIYAKAQEKGYRVIVSKEETGNDLATGTPDLNEVNYPVLPNDDAIRTARPVFLVREPKAAFDSWLAKGWDDIDAFITAYKNIADSYDRAKSVVPGTRIISYDAMVENERNQEMILRGVTSHWGLPFDPAMMSYDNKEFGQNFLYRSTREQDIYTKENPKGLFSSVMAHSGVQHTDGVATTRVKHGLITTDQVERLDRELGDIFARLDTECRLQAFRTQMILKGRPVRFDHELDNAANDDNYGKKAPEQRFTAPVAALG